MTAPPKIRKSQGRATARSLQFWTNQDRARALSGKEAP
jgi:hypothetical protein